MAKPIEPTPVLYGEDAKALQESLKTHASPEEMKRRVALAKQRSAEMMAPKKWKK